MAYEFPKDDRFRRIAAKIADAVLVKINSGWRISKQSSWAGVGNSSYCCPLGSLPGCTRRFPVSKASTDPSVTLTDVEFFAFIAGFDEGRRIDGESRSFNELGLAYRRRFVTGEDVR